MAVLNNKQFAVVLGVISLAMIVARSKVVEIGKAVDPTSRDNIFYKGVSSVTPQKSLGSWLYDLFN